MDQWTLSLRLLLAAGLAGVLGFEREWKGQHAGFRTHILVSVGACLFTIAGAYGFQSIVSHAAGQPIRVDVSRVASQVVVGIGFLGAGSILKQGMNVQGLTTAANLWVAAAVGLAVGIGYYVPATVGVVLCLFALRGLRPLERKLFPENPNDEDVTHAASDKRERKRK